MIPASLLTELYWDRKMSTLQIAAEYDLKKETVRGWMKKYGIPTRNKVEAALLSPSDWTPERVAMLRELWPTGMSIPEIHKRLGISYGLKSVSNKAKSLGLVMRPNPVKPKRKPDPALYHKRDERRLPAFPERSLIDFIPNLRLQTMWVECMQAVRNERGAQWGRSKPRIAR